MRDRTAKAYYGVCRNTIVKQDVLHLIAELRRTELEAMATATKTETMLRQQGKVVLLDEMARALERDAGDYEKDMNRNG